QAIIATEVLEIIRAPHLVKVAAHAGRIDVSDIDHAQRGGILEEQTEHISTLENLPVVVAFIPEAAILRIADVQIPRLTCHLKAKPGGNHEAQEVIHLHPTADRALLERGSDHRAAAF